jgi:glyoxylase-like metal-dependent hydrolase (beta-lactamase superfamily II)
MLKISCFTGGIASTNGYLVETAEGVFAVDAPEGMAAWLKAQGKAPAVLLLTHQHFDHVQDAAAIKRECGSRICAFAEFSRQLTLEFLMGFVSGTRFEVEEFPVDTLLKGGDTVEAGGLTWDVAYVPGHSADSITFYHAGEGIVFGGDVLMAGGMGRCDFPGGSEATLLAGIRQHLLTLPDETVVCSGHGPETTIGTERETNPYL